MLNKKREQSINFNRGIFCSNCLLICQVVNFPERGDIFFVGMESEFPVWHLGKQHNRLLCCVSFVFNLFLHRGNGRQSIKLTRQIEKGKNLLTCTNQMGPCWLITSCWTPWHLQGNIQQFYHNGHEGNHKWVEPPKNYAFVICGLFYTFCKQSTLNKLLPPQYRKTTLIQILPSILICERPGVMK